MGPTLPGEAFPGGHLFTVIPQPGLKSQPHERELLQLGLDPTMSGRRAFQVGAQAIHSVAGRTGPETYSRAAPGKSGLHVRGEGVETKGDKHSILGSSLI